MPLSPPQLSLALAALESGEPGALYQLGDLVCAAAAEQVAAAHGSAPALRQGLQQHRAETIERISTSSRAHCRALLRQLQSALPEDGAARASAALDAPSYAERLSHLAVERLLVHRAAPPLQVSPLPDAGLTALLAGARTVAVLFDYPLAIAHELYPLWTDAFVSAPAGAGPLVVVGVHVSWLDSRCRARRVIAYSEARDTLFEADLPAPQPLAAALILAQGPDTHRDVGPRLAADGVPHLNSCEGASTADDKWACYERWAAADVATPPTCLLRRAAGAAAVDASVEAFVESCGRGVAGWFVQPRHGTESAGVTWVEAGPGAAAGIAAAQRQVAASDDAILRPQVGLLWLADSEGTCSFDLRLHVCRLGDQWRAESGYLICARPGEPVSSVAGGARIERLARLDGAALAQHNAPAATGHLAWSADALERALDVAARAAATLDLELAGVDVKFDLVEGEITPQVLDVNPRPAGLLHADLVRGEPPEAGVGPSLWRRLDALIEARR